MLEVRCLTPSLDHTLPVNNEFNGIIRHEFSWILLESLYLNISLYNVPWSPEGFFYPWRRFMLSECFLLQSVNQSELFKVA